jgi:cell division FtsZ-interacting protein ZapD
VPGGSSELRTQHEAPVGRRRTRRQDELSDHLLPGEVLASVDPEDAAHWVAVYSELVDVLEGHPDRADLLEALGRYQARLSFWRARLPELVAERSDDVADPSEEVR